VLTRKTLAGAKTLFLAETNYELLAHEELLRGPKANADELRKIRTAKAAVDGLVKWLGDSADRLQVLAGAAAYAMEDGEADVKWIQLFTAALRAQKAVAASNIAAAVHDALPTTTLAVLLDDAMRIRVEEGRVHLDGTMRYRYATSLIRVADGLLVMSQGAGANRTRVETITELTDLANSVMPALIERYEPLRRVSEYSRVLALLRWARQPGNILAVDFADLGPVRASDRQSTPTADALRGRR